MAYWMFGTKAQEERKALSRILDEIDDVYLKWSLHEILTWKRKKPSDVFHIHGTKDKILPIRFVQPNVSIKGGTHFMILTHAAEINAVLRKELSKL